MSDAPYFHLKLSLPELENVYNQIQDVVDDSMMNAARDLAVATYGHIIEQVQQKLHSSRQKYIDSLSFEEVSEGVFEIRLSKEAMWIEEGMDRHEMIDDIIEGGSAPNYNKKDGSKFKRIPIQINKPPNAQTASQRMIANVVKRELRKAGIKYGGIERDAQGKPLIGVLHKMDIADKPIKTHHGVGQGHGDVGHVIQGMGGTPILHGLTVAQKSMAHLAGKNIGQMQDPSTRKDILTWRVISTKHKGTGRWIHPGVEAHNFFEDADTWMKSEWENSVKPSVLKELDVVLRNRP